MKNKKRGVILAGGLGTRLAPLTLTTNKHLLPVYDRQMIFFPLRTLVKSGATEILLVSGKQFIRQFEILLGSGKKFGASLSYGIQQNPKGGIADALKVAESFVGNKDFVVILGDNIFAESLNINLEKGKRAKVFVKAVASPKNFGIAEIKNRKLINILEKPKKPPTNLAVLGAYVYTPQVFKVISTLSPSQRGELEITDVNNYYARKGEIYYEHLRGFWADAGTFEDLFKSSSWRKSLLSNNEEYF